MAIDLVYKLRVNYVIYCCYGSDTGHIRVTIPGYLKVGDGLGFCAVWQVTSMNTR